MILSQLWEVATHRDIMKQANNHCLHEQSPHTSDNCLVVGQTGSSTGIKYGNGEQGGPPQG